MSETSVTSPAPADPPPAASARPTLSELFFGFAACSLSGFGGVLPFARRMIVEQKRWMTEQEFNEAFALAHFLPGPNIVNLSVVFGSRIRGALGAVVALIGLMGPPVVVVVLLAMVYARFEQVDELRRGLAGIAAAAAGLIIALFIKMAEPVFRHRFRAGPFLMVAVFVAIGLLRWPMPVVLAVMAPVSIGLAWWGAPL